MVHKIISRNLLHIKFRQGLQIVPEWQNYFNHPEGKALGQSLSFQSLILVAHWECEGMIGAAQNVGAFVVSLNSTRSSRGLTPGYQ